MLQSIHDKAKGILGIIIVAFIGLVFALWGIGDYLTGATEKAAARVDGEEITQSEFEQGLARQRQRMEQMFQGQVPDSPMFQQRMKEQVLEQLITRRVLQKMIEDEGYTVADEVLAQRIKTMEVFQENGVFAADTYHATIQSQGMAVKEFENLYRNDLAIQQLQDAVMNSSIVSNNELSIINQIQRQSRDINYLLFNDTQYLGKVSVSDEEVSDYFTEHQSRFMHPETVSISYVELKGDELGKDVPVDEEAVRRLYDEYVASLATKEQRKARHILVSLASDADEAQQASKKAAMEAIIKRLDNGESFEAVAKDASQDPGSAPKGGDLSWVSKGMMVPEFEKALFALKKGETSDIVKSSFGYHVIKLDDIKTETPVSFETKQAALETQYKAQLIEDKFYELSEIMATTAYENDQSLQAVADEVGLSIKTSSSFTRMSGPGIASNEKVRQAAFDSAVLSEGRNSDIIEMGKNHALVLRVDTHVEAKPKALEDVKNRIVNLLKADKAREQSQAAALTALAKLETGGSIDDSSVKASAELVKLGSVKRDDKAANQQLLREAFKMAKPQDKPVYKVAQLATGSAVIELKAVSASTDSDADKMQMLSRQMQNEQANRDMTAVLDYLKSQVTITRSEEL